MKPAPPAALVLSLVFASFQSACLAEASSGNNSTLTNHHPDPETLEQCHNLPKKRSGGGDPALGDATRGDDASPTVTHVLCIMHPYQHPVPTTWGP
ncbi:Transmembrane protein 213 [Myotis brandtii]|uniref:Transmembrane protein 213 n=1 Tax=Myotis brandtii TaxID=109478 RepID=S7NA36_MYOBR|nr:Transmembrane protein 213 [Myotis brandtii]